jgi:hypothetical protein
MLRIVGLETVTLAELPRAIAELEQAVASLWIRLHAHQATVLAAAPTTNLKLRVDQAAELVHRSVSWMRKHGATLPGFQKDEETGHVFWLERPLRTWATPPPTPNPTGNGHA